MASQQYEPTISLWENNNRQKITLKNRKTGKEYSFNLQNTCIIGRNKGACDVQITTDDRYISGRHLRFIFDGISVYAEDLKTKNGTRLNGKLLLSKAKIRQGDILRMGRSEYEVKM